MNPQFRSLRTQLEKVVAGLSRGHRSPGKPLWDVHQRPGHRAASSRQARPAHFLLPAQGNPTPAGVTGSRENILPRTTSDAGSGTTFLLPEDPRAAQATWQGRGRRLPCSGLGASGVSGSPPPGHFRTSWLASAPRNSSRGGSGRQAVRGGLVSTWPVFGVGGG